MNPHVRLQEIPNVILWALRLRVVLACSQESQIKGSKVVDYVKSGDKNRADDNATRVRRHDVGNTR